MNRLLQTFDITESRYERPNQPWICGHRRDGFECLQGPGENGVCSGRAECEPRRDGDRWYCTRSKAEGGTCDNGPNPDGSCCLPITPCQPTRSLRSRRGLFGIWLATIIASGLVIFFVAEKGWLLSPGELSSKHASLTNCASCHTNFNSTVATWLHRAVTLSSGSDAEICSSCHDLGDSSLMAHSLNLETLMELTTTQELSLASLAPSDHSIRTVEPRPEKFLAPSCGNCHREHKGAENTSMAHLSDDACQSCHDGKFEGFANGHPGFGGYPFNRRTRIQFDHSSHINNHFVDSDLVDLAPQGCLTCHQVGIQGQAMELAGYENTCSDCHDQQIKGANRAGGKGLTVIAIPEFDTDSLLGVGIDVGYWPAGGTDGIPPLLDFMLSGDEAYRQARSLTSKLDYYDLSQATEKQIVNSALIAWKVKQFYHDAIREGPDFFQRRIEKATGNALSAQQMVSLLALMPRSALNTIGTTIFPNLDAEVERFRQAPKAMLTLSVDPKEDAPPETVNSRNQVGAHIDFSEISLDQDIALNDDINFEEDINLNDDINFEEDINLDDDIDLADLSSPSHLSDELDDEYIDDLIEKPDQNQRVDDEEWASAGGWYWEDMSLSFRPTGHADPFLINWIEVAGSIQTDTSTRLSAALTANAAVGSCSKCHSTDVTETGDYLVNWRGKKSNMAQKDFTHFSHQTHTGPDVSTGCRTCHQINPDADYASSYESGDASHFESNFSPIDKATCAGCHQPPMAGESCLLCHNYHVGEGPSAILDMDDRLN